LTSDIVGRTDGRGWDEDPGRGKSELHRAGCLVKAREMSATASTVQTGHSGKPE